MEVRLLGRVEIRGGNAVLAPSRTAERCVLAALALSPGHPVHIDRLVDSLWGDQPPTKAEETIATHVRSVRRLIERVGGERAWLRSRRPGAYVLEIPSALVDYGRFTDLKRSAAASARAGGAHDSIDTYQRALDLWRGEPLEGIATAWADRRRQAIDRDYVDAVHELLEQQLCVGEYAAAVTRIQKLFEERIPTDSLIGIGLYSLAYSGHRASIPQFLDRARAAMRDLAGIGPSAKTQALARRLAEGADPDVPLAGAGTLPERAAPHGGHPDAAGETVTMVAVSSEVVYQSGRDQHIN